MKAAIFLIVYGAVFLMFLLAAILQEYDTGK